MISKCETCKKHCKAPILSACKWLVDNVICGDETVQDCPEYIFNKQASAKRIPKKEKRN